MSDISENYKNVHSFNNYIYQIPTMCQSLFLGLRRRSEKNRKKEKKKRISELEGEKSKHLK